MAKLMKLTPEHEALFPKAVERWIAHGLSTQPADWDTAEDAVRRLYRAADIPHPPHPPVRVASPIVGALAAARLTAWLGAFHRATERELTAEVVRASKARGRAPSWTPLHGVAHTADAAVSGTLHPILERAARSVLSPDASDAQVLRGMVALRRKVDAMAKGARPSWHYWYGGAFWAGWAARYDVFSTIAPAARCDAGDAYADFARSVGYAWLNRAFVLICDRPEYIGRDDRGQLHSDGSPTGHSIRYRDGWGLAHWHGVPIPLHAVIAPETITLDEIAREENAETRRVLIERYGPSRYLTETKSTVLDVDTVPVDACAPRSNSITRALIQDATGARWMVASDGSTERVYHMPLENTVQTCREAHRSLLPPGCPETMIAEC